MRWCPSTDTKGRDGHSFAYILHYLSTGDLIYPLHEGFHRVDVLLKASIPFSYAPAAQFFFFSETISLF